MATWLAARTSISTWSRPAVEALASLASFAASAVGKPLTRSHLIWARFLTLASFQVASVYVAPPARSWVKSMQYAGSVFPLIVIVIAPASASRVLPSWVTLTAAPVAPPATPVALSAKAVPPAMTAMTVPTIAAPPNRAQRLPRDPRVTLPAPLRIRGLHAPPEPGAATVDAGPLHTGRRGDRVFIPRGFENVSNESCATCTHSRYL